MNFLVPPVPQRFMKVMLCSLSATRATLKLIITLQRAEGTKIWLSEHDLLSSGPGQYDIRVASHSQMALITSREDRFKVLTDANPGPAAYQVREIPEISFKLWKQTQDLSTVFHWQKV